MTADVHSDSEVRPLSDLSSFRNSTYDPGRGAIVRTLWYYCSLLMFESGWLPVSGIKVQILRLFGARIGRSVVVKPHVRIKYPWRLAIGDHCWIGQNVWIDNIEDVSIGDHVCVSQLAYFCTGSHDHRTPAFDLLAKPIQVETGAWIGARATLTGGVTVHANAIAAAGAVVVKSVPAATIVGGNPAREIGQRNCQE
jgi:putative colanic acid biosynthesis acetyltransferase WcaF